MFVLFCVALIIHFANGEYANGNSANSRENVSPGTRHSALFGAIHNDQPRGYEPGIVGIRQGSQTGVIETIRGPQSNRPIVVGGNQLRVIQPTQVKGRNRRVNLVSTVLLAKYLQERKREREEAGETTANPTVMMTTEKITLPLPTPSRVLPGFTECSNGCQYRLERITVNLDEARARCSHFGFTVTLAVRGVQTVAERRSIFQTCLGPQTDDVMLDIIDLDGSGTIALPIWNVGVNTFYVPETGVTLFYFGSLAFSVGFAQAPGYDNLAFDDVNDDYPLFMCEYCP